MGGYSFHNTSCGVEQEKSRKDREDDGVIVDTTFLIDLLRNVPSTVSRLKELEKQNEPIITTTITVFEVWKGTDAEDAQKVNRILEMLNSIRVLPLDFKSAVEAGSIDRELSRKGISIDPEDSMIAGIAKVNNDSILTRNTKHFERIEGLSIEGY